MHKNHKISDNKQISLRQNKINSLVFLFKIKVKSTTR